MYTQLLILWIKGCQSFRKLVWSVNRHKSFGSGLTDVNEVCRCKGYILDNIAFFPVPVVLRYTMCDVEIPYPIILDFLVCVLILSTYSNPDINKYRSFLILSYYLILSKVQYASQIFLKKYYLEPEIIRSRILDKRSWEHNIVSYVVLVVNPYDILINLIQ